MTPRWTTYPTLQIKIPSCPKTIVEILGFSVFKTTFLPKLDDRKDVAGDIIDLVIVGSFRSVYNENVVLVPSLIHWFTVQFRAPVNHGVAIYVYHLYSCLSFGKATSWRFIYWIPTLNISLCIGMFHPTLPRPSFTMVKETKQKHCSETLSITMLSSPT